MVIVFLRGISIPLRMSPLRFRAAGLPVPLLSMQLSPLDFQFIVVHLFCRGLVLVLAGHRPIQRVASPAPRGRFRLLLAYWRYGISLCTIEDPTQAAAHGVLVVAAAVGDFVRYCTS